MGTRFGIATTALIVVGIAPIADVSSDEVAPGCVKRARRLGPPLRSAVTTLAPSAAYRLNKPDPEGASTDHRDPVFTSGDNAPAYQSDVMRA
jgi:hypothetical protein